MIKAFTHRLALRAETVADRLFHRTGTGRAIDPYIGYATPDHFILRGRVLSALRHATASEDQSKWENFKAILRMFLTDEVRDTRVFCGEVEAVTDEEGYFTLTLPRDDRTGWNEEIVSVEGGTETATCPFFVAAADADFMVISDIDDTMLETGAYSLLRNLWTSFTGNASTRHVFGDSITLMDALSNSGRNPVYYVSSSPWNLHDFLGDIFAGSGLVRGPMFLRDLGLSKTKFITEGHGNHKGGSIDHILRANPDLPAILLGDTGQHDAHIYTQVIHDHPGRILAVGLRTPGPGMDAADKHDLSELQATGVISYAAPTFEGMGETLRSARPDLFGER